MAKTTYANNQNLKDKMSLGLQDSNRESVAGDPQDKYKFKEYDWTIQSWHPLEIEIYYI